ncbi:helix-turn-helix transcriptional regulator [Bacillus sp. FSL W7-1360]
MNFTPTVKTAMKNAGLKKSDLARMTGYSYQYIRDLLRGDRRWNEDTIERVSGALGIKVDYKLCEEVSDVDKTRV